jgi:flotillin
MVQEDMKNEYLEQVKAQQQRIEVDLKAQRAPSPNMIPPAAAAAGMAIRMPGQKPANISASGMADNLGQAVNVRIVGFWSWKTVIVPPNAYVVHTRRGYDQPLHLGLGISFRFNPFTDSFLVVPSTMQTILINAQCICREMQGLLVQGYVQWIIADFSTAYKKLDFTDAIDPMRVVNVQLREQAEAAIKDKVATMGIDDVLSDKQPIIQELTARLREVAEGEGNSDKGLGLRIVTVQIKEAVVSSARLWENLQKPFRAERARVARLAELNAESIIKAQELEHEKTRSSAQLESESEIATLRASKESMTFDREQSEKTRRHQKEQEVTRQAIIERNATAKQEQQGKRELEEIAMTHSLAIAQARMEAKHQELLKEIELRNAQMAKESEAVQVASNLNKLRLEKDSELARLRIEEEINSKEIMAGAENSLREASYLVTNRQTEAEIEFETARQRIHNDMSPSHLQARLVEIFPSIVEKLPKPDELRTISIGNGAGSHDGQALVSIVTQILAVLDTFRSRVGPRVDDSRSDIAPPDH